MTVSVNSVPNHIPCRTAEMITQAPGEAHPMLASFTRPTTEECLRLAEHLTLRGFKMYVYNRDDIVVSPVTDDGLAARDMKMITCYDDRGLSAAQFLRALDLKQSDTDPIKRSFEIIAKDLGREDWRSLTVDQCAGFERRKRARQSLVYGGVVTDMDDEALVSQLMAAYCDSVIYREKYRERHEGLYARWHELKAEVLVRLARRRDV